LRSSVGAAGQKEQYENGKRGYESHHSPPAL
jgi:hypothetical protein